MRIVYILITFVCLALSIVFMYFGFSNKSGITDANNMLAEQEQKVKDAQNNLNELQQTLASKKAEKSGLELQVRYRTEPTAFLTFNSVPSSNTAKILDILKENNVKATFYITGSLIQTDEDRAVVKRIVDEGHAIGIRAYGRGKIYGRRPKMRRNDQGHNGNRNKTCPYARRNGKSEIVLHSIRQRNGNAPRNNEKSSRRGIFRNGLVHGCGRLRFIGKCFFPA